MAFVLLRTQALVLNIRILISVLSDHVSRCDHLCWSRSPCLCACYLLLIFRGCLTFPYLTSLLDAYLLSKCLQGFNGSVNITILVIGTEYLRHNVFDPCQFYNCSNGSTCDNT